MAHRLYRCRVILITTVLQNGKFYWTNMVLGTFSI